MARGAMPKKKKKGMATGGLKMVMKNGKKVPFYAADGKGKMYGGGMAKKKGMAKGAMAKKKKKGMAVGGMKKKGMALGGMKRKPKGMARGGFFGTPNRPLKKKGRAKGGARGGRK